MKTLKITYIYDPLCGWCYGFSPVIKQFFKKFRSKLDFEVISGGMVLGDRIGPIGKVAAYIEDAYKVVEERTGVKFGEAFLTELKDGKMIFTSIPPSRALTAFKEQRPKDAIFMAHEIQKGIYYKGIAPSNASFYLDLAKKFELNLKQFEDALHSEEVAKKTEQEFKKSTDFGVSGFPTVLIGNDDEVMPISRGYQDYEDLLMNAINGAAYFEVDLLN